MADCKVLFAVEMQDQLSFTSIKMTDLPDRSFQKMVESVDVSLLVAVPEGLWQQLVVQLAHILRDADGVVQARQVDPVVVVSKVVETEKVRAKNKTSCPIKTVLIVALKLSDLNHEAESLEFDQALIIGL